MDQPDYEKEVKQKASTALGIVYENKILVSYNMGHIYCYLEICGGDL